ncbi:MAG: hypothetical protein ACFFD7_00130 [Candidatus Thorarchaeota archaeon]
MLSIKLEPSEVKIPENVIGVDMGQTLSKVVYLENNELKLSYYNTQTDFNFIKELLERKVSKFKQINFTGGKCFALFQSYSKRMNTKLINEFEANVKGVEILHLLEKKKVLPSAIIITIGTGTSIVSKNEQYEHLGGSALGGGFFMGIIKTLFNLDDFDKAMEFADNGNRYNLDLKVSDIYDPEDTRVDLLFREFTAASLGKLDLNFNMKLLKKEDFINSLLCMIGENIGTIANLMADKVGISTLVFCGGFLRENKITRRLLSLLCTVNKKKAIFLNNSEFNAAIGALAL